jgi:hypothetical protein
MKRRESLPIKRNTQTYPNVRCDFGVWEKKNSHQLAIKLKDLAKVYNMIIVLAVPLQILISNYYWAHEKAP